MQGRVLAMAGNRFALAQGQHLDVIVGIDGGRMPKGVRDTVLDDTGA
jgi:hypothetical protein